MNKRVLAPSGTNQAIPAPSLTSSVDVDPHLHREPIVGTRVAYMSALAIMLGALVGLLAKGLVALINLITNLAFLGRLSVLEASPKEHHLGIGVLFVPVIGGLIVGLMARYGSKAIRGHGIPEAMEQVLLNESRINPSITILKPISSAISIGTGGPFGAEGPIIATGGAVGSLLGQLLRITAHERKVLLTCGAAAGMAAIFGSPVAAVMLAIELLLFEFSPRSIIPVALASVTGAAFHLLLFGTAPAFAMPVVPQPTAAALAAYVALGLAAGVAAGLVSRSVYKLEDAFEKLPIHWMWWPAIGGIAVGAIGIFAPETMGVGYDNITSLLSGTLPLRAILVLCVLKYCSWAVSLSSGTSGGTLAPLLTIGGAFGALAGMLLQHLIPGAGIDIPTAALVGMAAMFTGASRALLASIIFALETTMQPHALLPLLGGCIAAYFVSYLVMRGSIMTEKIERRGVRTPQAYEPDILRSVTVGQVMQSETHVLSAENTVREVREWIKHNATEATELAFAVVTEENQLIGLVNRADIFSRHSSEDGPISEVVRRNPPFLYAETTLDAAVDLMQKFDTDLLPVVTNDSSREIVGVLVPRDVFKAYSIQRNQRRVLHRSISLKRARVLAIIVRGRKLLRRD
ncbi:MAG: chloride channel protein [Bacteroidetes bacterium]|nr:chloride channel protein [Bacteroidota bacterium]